MKHNKLLITPALVIACGLALAGCSSGNPTPPTSGAAGTFHSGNATYDAIINGGAVADAATVAGNQWASKIKAAGVLRTGGAQDSVLFSLLDPTTNVLTGFDAGLSQLLARYIIGDAKTTMTQTTVATREQLLMSNVVDTVFATYSITAPRMQKIDFAGPYYQSQTGILVTATNTTINGVGDLAGKKVATEQGAPTVAVLQQQAPAATVIQLPDNASCLNALRQGDVDAYVLDQSILLSDMVGDASLKLTANPFGTSDNYGIGLPKGSDAKAFVNAWLQKIETDGTWLNLWKATIQAKTKTQQLPTPPAIGSAGN